jgi:hypothetical protein
MLKWFLPRAALLLLAAILWAVIHTPIVTETVIPRLAYRLFGIY